MASQSNRRAPASTGPLRSPLGRFVGLLALGLLFAAPVLASYWDEYKKARDAVEAGNWQEAEKFLRAALAEEPEAKRRPLGARYTPYYYLGIVLQETGDCRGALEAWRTSEKANIVKAGSDESKDRERRKSRCEQLTADVRQAKSEVDDALRQGKSALQGVDRLKNQQALQAAWTSGRPSFADRRQQAAALLDRALQKASAGERALDLDQLADARRDADKADRDLDNLSAEVEALLGEASAARNKASRELDKAQGQAEQQIASLSDLKPFPPQLGRRVSALQRSIDQTEQKQEAADQAELESLAKSLRSGIQTLRRQASGPPKALTEAADAYLANDFARVLEGLAEADLKSDRARFHGSLLKAAALHALSIVGDNDPELLIQAKEAVGDCVAFDPDQKLGAPGERFFSPVFLDFWQQTNDYLRAEPEEADAEGSEEVAEPTP